MCSCDYGHLLDVGRTCAKATQFWQDDGIVEMQAIGMDRNLAEKCIKRRRRIHHPRVSEPIAGNPPSANDLPAAFRE